MSVYIEAEEVFHVMFVRLPPYTATSVSMVLPCLQSIDALVTQLHSQPSSSSQLAMQAQFGVTAYCPRNPSLPPANAPPAVSNISCIIHDSIDFISCSP